MTAAQVELLARLIAAERSYLRQEARGERPDPAWRGIEVGRINGVCPRTARSLAECGLVELSDSPNNRSLWAFLAGELPAD